MGEVCVALCHLQSTLTQAPSCSSSGSSRRGHPDRVIQTGSSRVTTQASHVTHTKLVFCFESQVTHTHTFTYSYDLNTHTLCIQLHIHLKLPLRNHAANRRRVGFILAHTHCLTRTGSLLVNHFAPFSHR